ncbi:hypothetical protein [Pseudomonas inefficax]|uniref:hypothetical protein n=1 Tax=Pseudomonas inefficax TaxID=2078786 RepID=UPI004046AEA3
MARMIAVIVCSHRWWLKYYLAGVLTIAKVTGSGPNPDRVAYWVGRGIKVEVR